MRGINQSYSHTYFMTSKNKTKSKKIIQSQTLLLRRNSALWAELLKSVSITGHTSGPASPHYIKGYLNVFEKWGILTDRNINIVVLDQILRSYNKTGLLPDF